MSIYDKIFPPRLLTLPNGKQVSKTQISCSAGSGDFSSHDASFGGGYRF